MTKREKYYFYRTNEYLITGDIMRALGGRMKIDFLLLSWMGLKCKCLKCCEGVRF
jgi:hypothetical protein